MKNRASLKKLGCSLLCIILAVTMVFPTYALSAQENTDDTVSVTQTVTEDASTEVEQNTVTEQESEEYTMSEYGYLEMHKDIPEYQHSKLEIASSPEAQLRSYNSASKGYVTSIKNQGEWGTCWALSATSAAESSILAQGKTVDSGKTYSNTNLDFSELHLAFFFYNTFSDPLGGTNGDVTACIGGSYLERGGNNYLTGFALAGWRGAAYESVAPWGSITGRAHPLSFDLNYVDAAHLQNYYWVDMKDINLVKEMIVKYGSVVISYQHSYAYYNSYKHSYYCNDASLSGYGHSVVVIGWNDDYRKTDYCYGKDAPANGAWIVKNSWGTGWGSGGTFYLSYYDQPLRQDYGVVLDFEDSDNYDNNYQYDGTTNYDTLSIPAQRTNPTRLANQYEVKASDHESLEAVSFALESPNVNYSIQVYKKDTMNSAPDQGTPMLAKPVTGCTQYTGYYTVELPEPILFDKGDVYSIVISISHSSDNASIFVEITDSCNSWIHFTNACKPNTSYFSWGQDSAWVDLASYVFPLNTAYTQGYTLRIKGFTDNVALVNNEFTKISSDDAMNFARYGHSYSFTLTPDPGEFLPDGITIVQGDDVLEMGVDFSYDSETGDVIVYNITGDITVQASAYSDCAHQFSYTVVKGPTCTETGKARFVCALCGFTYTGKYTEALGHDNTTTVVAPTCTRVGYTHNSCSRCGLNYSENQIPETGHTYGEWVTVKASTSSAVGEKQRECEVCGYVETSLICNSKQHIVTFDANGGYDAPAQQIKVYPNVLTLTYATPTRPGYTFKGWGLTPDATTVSYAQGQLYGYDTDVTMYAIWEKKATYGNAHTLTLNADGGTVEGGSTYSVTTGQLMYTLFANGALPTPQRNGYVFYGWYDENGKQVSQLTDTTSYELDADTTYTAYWYSCSHSEFAEIVVVSPKCVETGLKKYVCTTCFYSYTEVIPASGHAFDNEVVAPTCTEAGYTTHTCRVCKYSFNDTPTDALGHFWSSWEVVTPATATENGLKRRDCVREGCNAYETEVILATGEDEPVVTDGVSVNNYTLIIMNAEEITAIRFAKGIYTTASEIKNAEGVVNLSEAVIKANLVNGNFKYELPDGGVYSVWYKYADGTQKIATVDASVMTQTVDADGVKVTVNNLYGVKDFWIAQGTYTTYRDIKNAPKYISVTSSKFGKAHSYTYPSAIGTPGDYTCIVRYNDSSKSDSVIYFTCEVTTPDIIIYGREIIIGNLKGVKAVRIAEGYHTSVSEIKSAPGALGYSAATVAKLADENGNFVLYKNATEEGTTYSVAVIYENFYQEVYVITLKKKVPSYTVDGNSITFTNLEGLSVFRYVPGKYYTANGIKNGEGSRYIRPSDITEGKITLSGLTGKYSFLVQYREGSQSIINVTFPD